MAQKSTPSHSNRRNLYTRIFNNPEFSDITFVLNGNTKLYAERNIVASASQVFYRMLKGNFSEAKKEEIAITVCEEESFRHIIAHVYCIDVDFSHFKVEVVCEILNLANQYELKDLFNEVKNYLNQYTSITIESLVLLMNTAQLHNLDSLYKKAKNLYSKNADILIMNEALFNDINESTIKDLLATRTFDVREINLLVAVLKWIDRRTINDKTAITENVDTTEPKAVKHFVENDKKGSGSNTTTSSSTNSLKGYNLLKYIRFPEIPVSAFIKQQMQDEHDLFEKYQNTIDSICNVVADDGDNIKPK